jgi:hypothetical protein
LPGYSAVAPNGKYTYAMPVEVPAAYLQPYLAFNHISGAGTVSWGCVGVCLAYPG